MTTANGFLRTPPLPSDSRESACGEQVQPHRIAITMIQMKASSRTMKPCRPRSMWLFLSGMRVGMFSSFWISRHSVLSCF